MNDITRRALLGEKSLFALSELSLRRHEVRGDEEQRAAGGADHERRRRLAVA